MVHHTSFLWDYDPGAMSLLRLPERRPDYRRDRPHTQFLCRLRDSVPTQGEDVSGWCVCGGGGCKLPWWHKPLRQQGPHTPPRGPRLGCCAAWCGHVPTAGTPLALPLPGVWVVGQAPLVGEGVG